MQTFNHQVVLDAIVAERERQNEKWGVQNHPDGTGHVYFKSNAERAKAITEHAAKIDSLQWWHILDEEVQEAFAEDDPQKLREELIHVAAVAVQWVECIDRRTNAASHKPEFGL